MLRRAASRACGRLAIRHQQQGSQLQRKGCGSQYTSFSTLGRTASPSFASSSNSSSSPNLDIPSRANFYLYLLGKYPILTKSVTASAIMLSADAASQAIVSYRTKSTEAAQWNVERLLLAGVGGAIISGPLFHFWFNFAARISPAQTVLSTLKKLALEQLILAPATAVAFFSFNRVVRGKSVTETAEEIKPIFPTVLKGELLYWPVASFITYRRVPVPLQPVVRCSFFFLWSILSNSTQAVETLR